MKRLLSVLLTVLLFSVLVVGCKAPAKKPAPTPPPPAAPKSAAPSRVTPAPARKPAAITPMPTTAKDAHALATKLAKEANKVKGVKKATVALSGTTAYVGLDLDAKLEAGKTNAVKKEVADKVKKADKRLTNVYVTSDVGIVQRIKNVATGIGQGKPLTGFTTELSEIGRRIVPKPAK